MHIPTGRVKQYLWDRVHNVETRQPVETTAPHGVLYQPTSPKQFNKMLRSLHIDFRRTTFVDLGSGKGRVLFLAAQYPFQRVIGVEFSSHLHNLAERNLKAWRGKLHCSNIELVNNNVLDYEFPLSPLILFMYNPFDSFIMVRVVEHIRRSLEQHPRDLIILCVGKWTKRIEIESGLPRISSIWNEGHDFIYRLPVL